MKSDPAQLSPNLRFNSLPDGLAVTGTLLALGQLAAPALAQDEKKEEDKKPEELSELVVDANQEKKLYKPERLQSPKVTQPLRDVAKTITVIPEEVIQQQGSSNLRDVLRNVPGISMQAGEGGGGPAGDNLSIRGFSARSDIFVDGMRDTAGGGYSRDPFNMEQVEVTKGPSSTTTGRGSTGGSINIVTKNPKLENAYNLMLGGGTDDYFRGTFDVNQTIPNVNGVAVRLNGLYHTQNIPGRDYVENERWGIAPSIAVGLGTDTRFTLNYMHLDQDNVPDYGIPWVARTSTNPQLPPGRPPVSYDTFYGNLNRDYEETITDILTGTFEHDFNENLKLRSTLRYGRNDRDGVVTAPRFASVNTSPTLNQQFQSRDQVDDAIYSQTDLRYDFNTGTVEHNLVAGVEFGREESINYGRAAFNNNGPAPVPQTNLWFPNPFGMPSFPVRTGAFTETTSDTAAIYLFDTVKLNDCWEINGGLRGDSYDVDYLARNVAGDLFPLQRDDSMLSYQGSITYKPVKEGSIYLAYGTSFNPSTENLTYIAAPTATNNTLSLFQADPEENETLEFGAKWEFFDEKLLLSSAVFRTDKKNARTSDPVNPAIVTLTGEQVVKGFEFGFTGQITEQWSIIGGYTYLDGEVKESAVPVEVGSDLSNTPENSFSLWTVYELPKGIEVGVGTQFVDSRFNNNNQNTRQTAPSFTIFNAMVGYQVTDNLHLQLNVDNLTDEDYIDRVGGGHFIPGWGRSAVLSATMTF